MIGPAPETMWGDKYVLVDPKGNKESVFNHRLKSTASDDEKHDFESYAMVFMGGNYFMGKMHPEMEDPYYTWEGKVVERSSLKGRKIPVVKKTPRDRRLT